LTKAGITGWIMIMIGMNFIKIIFMNIIEVMNIPQYQEQNTFIYDYRINNLE